MRDSLVDPGRQKAEKVRGDVRCLTFLIVHGKMKSVMSFVPDKNPSRINDFQVCFSPVVSAWGCKNPASHAGPDGSLFPPDHLFEVELALCCHNRQLVLKVVCDKVAYALK